MFGLTLEKLIIVGIIAAIIIGPQRLPLYADKLAKLIRSFHAFTEAMKTRAESELGVPLDVAEWNVQLQQYDPRRVVREALAGDAGKRPGETTPNSTDTTDAELSPRTQESPATESPLVADHTVPGAATRERWVVVGGSSGHPRRRRVVEPILSEPPAVSTDESHQEEEIEQNTTVCDEDRSPEQPSSGMGRGEGTGNTAFSRSEAQAVP